MQKMIKLIKIVFECRKHDMMLKNDQMQEKRIQKQKSDPNVKNWLKR